MFTPTQRGMVVIARNADREYDLAEYLGEKGEYGEHFKLKFLVGPEITEYVHFEDIHKLTDKNRELYL